MTEEQEKAVRDFNAARTALQRSTGGKTASGLEKAYSDAYQVCVRLGIMPQIRKKYR
jgi:hypothetical protein